MQSSKDPGKSTRRYLHACRKCKGKFKVLIRVDIRTVHQAACPHCKEANYFDNRKGQLTGQGRAVAANPGPEALKPAPEPAKKKSKTRKKRTTVRDAYDIRNHTGRNPGLSTEAGLSSPVPHSYDSHAGGGSAPIVRDYARAPDSEKKKVSRQPLWWHRSGKSSSTGSRSIFQIPGLPRLPGLTGGSLHDIALTLRDFSDSISDMLPGRRGNWPALLGGSIVLGVLGILFILFTLQFPALYLKQSPEEYLKKIDGVQANRIVDRHGILIGELFQKKTGNINPDAIPGEMAATLVFTEDTAFYDHKGVSWAGIGRAFIKNISSFGYSQGGSTLTQQLARILLTTRDKNILRKLRETSLAFYLEDHLQKEEILAAYMSHVYLGHGALGFDNASRFYFDLELNELNFEQRLALACLPSAPARYSPFRNPDKLRIKMDFVYERMADADVKVPGEVEYHKRVDRMLKNLNKSPLASIFGNRVNDAPYVAEHIRLRIRKILGPGFEYGAGLRIETTLDKKLQRAAVREIKAYIREKSVHFPPVRMQDDKVIYRYDKSPDAELQQAASDVGVSLLMLGYHMPPQQKPRLQAAAVGIESRTGQIVFMQGGTDFASNNQLNRVVQMRRQTGSSIKPIVYSAAIESGAVNPATLLEDRPIFVSGGANRDYWLPGNYSGVYEGDLPVRTALAKSQNIPAIQVLRKASMQRVTEQFKKFFFPDASVFNRRYREDETVAIGSLEMSPLEMATAYTAFGNNGEVIRPYLIDRILASDGKLLYSHDGEDEFNLRIPERRQVIRPDAAHIMVSLMRDSAKYGGVGRGGMSGNFIGKTGTSNAYRDTWFIGLTPDISAAVWVGYDDQRYSMYKGTGAGLAGPLWGRIMRHAPRSGKGFSFKPAAIYAKVCAETGYKPDRLCTRVISEMFLKDYLPGKNPNSGHQYEPDGKIENSNHDKKENSNDSNPVEAEVDIGSDSDFD